MSKKDWRMLQEYKSTGLTPQEIMEMMKKIDGHITTSDVRDSDKPVCSEK